ncbi:MAG: hypothetical protein AAF703_06885 [Cyanobacteria bacterium P01_D01_bin.105]
MFHSSAGEAWCKLLFNAMSVPFIFLLIGLVVSQMITAQNNAELEPSGDPSELVGDVLF